LEGIISRGDESVGEIISAAYLKGARLDAWDEHIDRELWRKVLDDYNKRRGEGAWQSFWHSEKRIRSCLGMRYH